VILPAAVPGIFSATMIGLGRAIGETMIVLMAAADADPRLDDVQRDAAALLQHRQ